MLQAEQQLSAESSHRQQLEAAKGDLEGQVRELEGRATGLQDAPQQVTRLKVGGARLVSCY